jgi:hypothetical protein
LRWKEWFQQSGECGEIARLNQNLAGPDEFSDDAFATDHAAKKTCRGFAQSVLRRAFPRNEVTGVNNVALTREMEERLVIYHFTFFICHSRSATALPVSTINTRK